MALNSNALTAIAALRRHLRAEFREIDHLNVYHDGTGVSSATIEVTTTALILTTNLLTSTLTFSSNATLTAMVAAINSLDNWVVTLIGEGGQDTTGMTPQSSLSALLIANIRHVRGTDSELFADAINMASDAIERICSRSFQSATYKQGYHGKGSEIQMLRNYPVTRVFWVSVGRMTSARIKYTSLVARQAVVSVDGTNLTLTVSDTDTDIAIGSNTLTQLKVLVDAESGWTMDLAGSNVGEWLASDVLHASGRDALNVHTELHVPERPDSQYETDMEHGIIRRGPEYTGAYVDTEASYARPLFGAPSRRGSFPHGTYNVFVKYTAGYSTIPSALEQIALELATNIYRVGRRDGLLVSESTPIASYATSGESALTQTLRDKLVVWTNTAPMEALDV